MNFYVKIKNFYKKIKSIAQNMQWTWLPHVCGEKKLLVLSTDLTEGSPHVCGEKYSGLMLKSKMGSPPRVWGKEKALEICVVCDRITPTHVGKSCLHDRKLGMK